MADIHIDFDMLDGLDGPLNEAASDLDALAHGVPADVDAGLMTSVVTAMIAQVVESAGTVSACLRGAADASDDAYTYYRRADADAAASMEEIQQAVGR